MLAPAPFLSACLGVLHHAAIHARLLGYAGKAGHAATERCAAIADLMDAVHNIPDLIARWEDCDQRLLRAMLEDFDAKWGHVTGCRLLAAYERTV